MPPPSSTISRTGRNRLYTPGLKLAGLIWIGLFENLRLFVRVNPLLERVIDSFYSPSDIGRESINRLAELRVEIPTMKLMRTLKNYIFCGVNDNVFLIIIFLF